MSLSSFVALTDAEKMQSLDLPASLLMIGMGAAFIGLRKKLASARQARVQKGEMSAEQAKKADRLVLWGGCTILALGLLVLVLWATGH